MVWKVAFVEELAAEIVEMEREVRRELIATVRMLELGGPHWGAHMSIRSMGPDTPI